MKTRKLITGALLSLILVVSLFIPAAAFSISSTPDSVTVHLDSPEDLDYKNQSISIPAGYTFDDLTSISGVYLVTPEDGSDPYYLSRIPFGRSRPHLLPLSMSRIALLSILMDALSLSLSLTASIVAPSI